MAVFGALIAPFAPLGILAAATGALAHPRQYSNFALGLAVIAVPATALVFALRSGEPKLARFWWAFASSEVVLFLAGMFWGDFERVKSSLAYNAIFWIATAGQVSLLAYLTWRAPRAIAAGVLLSAVLLGYWDLCWMLAGQILSAPAGSF